MYRTSKMPFFLLFLTWICTFFLLFWAWICSLYTDFDPDFVFSLICTYTLLCPSYTMPWKPPPLPRMGLKWGVRPSDTRKLEPFWGHKGHFLDPFWTQSMARYAIFPNKKCPKMAFFDSFWPLFWPSRCVSRGQE